MLNSFLVKQKKMYFLFVICFICFLSVSSGSDDPIVDYYVNLINNETARIATVPGLQDSSAFRTLSDQVLDYGTFDYIIVGAGSAGAVIANRLSAIQGNQILLLEAGGLETDFSEIPGMAFYSHLLEFNWNFNTTPQHGACLGMINRQCAYARGRGLGGSSIINGLMYVRGNKLDYDKWYNQGNPGWSYEDVLPYFTRSEDAHVTSDEGYHGYGGYLNVEYPRPYSPHLGAFLDANIELGRKFIDYNGKDQLGVSLTQFNTINGRRHSTGKAFLAPVINRPNLTILTNSLVIRILIEPLTKRAYGVLFSNNGQQVITKARKEVIISAGTFGSPQLLMLSGIGPEEHLTSLGIPVIQPLSVGDNFHDHAGTFSIRFETNYVEPVKTLKEYVREYLHGVGPLAVPNNVQGIAFLQTNISKLPNYPDIEIIVVAANSTSDLIRREAHLTDETFNNVIANLDHTRTLSLYLAVLHPKSRGTVRLKSSDPYEYPLIDPMLLTDPYGEDIETLYQGVQLALEIGNTEAFKRINAKLTNTQLPDCQIYEYFSKEYWYCHLRHMTFPFYHPVGTCKMGPDPQNGAVVNHELKVHGINNLRVADASIIPEIISGHTNAVAIMIGEKVSDMIISEGLY